MRLLLTVIRLNLISSLKRLHLLIKRFKSQPLLLQVKGEDRKD
jgi:hypothetical protein